MTHCGKHWHLFRSFRGNFRAIIHPGQHKMFGNPVFASVSSKVSWTIRQSQNFIPTIPASRIFSRYYSKGASAFSAPLENGSSSNNPLERLIENNRRWRAETLSSEGGSYFSQLATGQSPKYLWIGCSDSRVPPELITGSKSGEMFVHRNIANLVVANDMNLLSVIAYAVEHLKVQDIVICGHYGCGGVHASMQNQDLGLLDNWIRNIRDVQRVHLEELEALKTEDERFRRLVELNVQEQCVNIFKMGVIQRHQMQFGAPRIHGLVYELKTGELKKLDIPFETILPPYQEIYSLLKNDDEEEGAGQDDEGKETKKT